MATTSPPFAEPLGGAIPPRRRGRTSQPGIALLLIAIGVSILAANTFALGGGAVLLVVGATCAAARLMTGRYGYAVAAGPLLGLGTYTLLRDTALLPADDSGWALFLLALGFVATYAVGARPGAVWPLVPAAALGAGGALLFWPQPLGPVAQLAWTARLWPVALVLWGAWILLRDRLPPRARRAAGWLTVALIVCGATLAAAAVTAASRAGVPPASWSGAGTVGVAEGPFRWSVPWLALNSSTTNLTTRAAAGDTLRIRTPSGRVVLSAAGGPEITAAATKHFRRGDEPPNAQLTQVLGGWSLDVTLPPGSRLLERGRDASIDLDVAVPAGVRVEAETGSGTIWVRDVPGLRLATTGSGAIRLTGVLSADTQVRSGSGAIAVGLAPGSSVRIAASTGSGRVMVRNLALVDGQVSRRSATGTVGGGAGTLTIHTGSGNVTLSAT